MREYDQLDLLRHERFGLTFEDKVQTVVGKAPSQLRIAAICVNDPLVCDRCKREIEVDA